MLECKPPLSLEKFQVSNRLVKRKKKKIPLTRFSVAGLLFKRPSWFIPVLCWQIYVYVQMELKEKMWKCFSIFSFLCSFCRMKLKPFFFSFCWLSQQDRYTLLCCRYVITQTTIEQQILIEFEYQVMPAFKLHNTLFSHSLPIENSN